MANSSSGENAAKPLRKLDAAFKEIAADQDTLNFLNLRGSDLMLGGPKELKALLTSDIARWKEYARLARIEPL